MCLLIRCFNQTRAKYTHTLSPSLPCAHSQDHTTHVPSHLHRRQRVRELPHHVKHLPDPQARKSLVHREGVPQAPLPEAPLLLLLLLLLCPLLFLLVVGLIVIR